jgi:hypothetical protein
MSELAAGMVTIHLLVHMILTKRNMSELAAGMDAVQLKSS